MYNDSLKRIKKLFFSIITIIISIIFYGAKLFTINGSMIQSLK